MVNKIFTNFQRKIYLLCSSAFFMESNILIHSTSLCSSLHLNHVVYIARPNDLCTSLMALADLCHKTKSLISSFCRCLKSNISLKSWINQAAHKKFLFSQFIQQNFAILIFFLSQPEEFIFTLFCQKTSIKNP